jgi:ParB-like chromosome segregation protein Spo0J
VEAIKKSIEKELEKSSNKIDFINELRSIIHDLDVIKQPIDFVRWVDINKVEPNDYNPNSVAKVEMSLLYKSIFFDGYTQPIVTIYNPDNDKYVIVDGFHRYFVAKTQKDILDRNKGTVPIVVINKDINDRMSSTIRHNRARGEHSVSGMSNMVFKMLENGWSDAEICNNLGMEAEELLKLKHITGFSKLFQDTEYRRAWESKNQLRIRKEYENNPNLTAQDLNKIIKEQ